MFTNELTPTLGALPAPAWHRPWFRYADPVPGAEAGAPAAQVTPPADPPAIEQPKPHPPAAPAKPADDTPPWSAEEYDREKAWKKIQAQKADLDAERAKRDTAVKDAETAAEKRAKEAAYREFGKQLGLVEDDTTPTVDSLTATLQERDTTLTQTQAALAAQRAENAVLRYAGKHGGNSDALLDSRDFEKKLAAIDSTASDYASQVEALVKSEVESNARYRTVQVAPSSSDGGTPPSGGSKAPKDDIESLRASYRKSRGQD